MSGRSGPPRTFNQLNTVSLRTRVTLAVIGVLALTLLLLSVAVNAIFVAQSNRTVDGVLTDRVQLARQLARTGVGPAQLVRRVSADGVLVRLQLVGGEEFGDDIPTGAGIRTVAVVLQAPGPRVDGSTLTLAVDTAVVTSAHRTLRRVLALAAAGTLLVSALLVAAAVRIALRPLGSMATLARSIAGGQRGYRLAPTRTDTELGQTAAALDDMLDELEGAETRARQAEQRTRAFLADAAHELRTPITGIQAAAETLLHHGEQMPAADRQQLEALLIRETHRAGALVSDLLAAARLDAGLELERQPVSLGALVQAELDRARLLQPGVALTQSGPDVVVSADPARISSVVRNVLDNALRASGSHGQIHVVLRTEGGDALVEVWDSGPGVPVAERERIFDRLVRLDHSRTVDSGGSGLGLAIARGYARAHGGDLTCEDPRGSGAMFRLRLPLRSPTGG